jgi:hypothetical protein
MDFFAPSYFPAGNAHDPQFFCFDFRTLGLDFFAGACVRGLLANKTARYGTASRGG